MVIYLLLLLLSLFFIELFLEYLVLRLPSLVLLVKFHKISLFFLSLLLSFMDLTDSLLDA